MPTVTVPKGVSLDDPTGRWGGDSAAYVRKLASGMNALPGPLGKLTPRFIERMRRDAQVTLCLLVNQHPFLRADWSIACDDPDIAEWMTAAVELIIGPIKKSMGHTLPWGYSPNELVATFHDDLNGLVYSELRDLEPKSCKPLVDDRGDYVGFIQDEGMATEAIIEAPVTLWLTEGMEFGNLYGRSVLESAFDPWQDKEAFRAFHARALERFGEPVVKTRAPAGTSVANALEIAARAAEIEAATAAGTEVPPPIDPVFERDLDTALDMGRNLRHHSVVALPSTPHIGPKGDVVGYAWELEFLEAQKGASSDFIESMRERDKAIARGIFVPDLLVNNGETVGSNALGQSHRDVWTLGVEGRMDGHGAQITRQICDRLRVWNFGPKSPAATFSFAPMSDEDRDQLWTIAATLIDDGRLNPDVHAVAERIGLALDPDAPQGGPKPEPPAPVIVPDPNAPPVEPGKTGRGREVIVLSAGQDVTGLPEWKLPQSYQPPPYVRDLNARERRVGFAKIEGALNTAEARTIARLDDVLERERDRAQRQLDGILRKSSASEIIAGLGSIELKGTVDAGRAWGELMRDVWAVGLDGVRQEIEAYAASIPTSVGPAGEAMVKAYAQSAAERVFTQLTTELRFELLNAYTSDVSRAGMAARLSAIFDAYEAGEGKGPRLTTRMLSSKALNESRADAIERGGVPLAGAQYSAILDRRTCELCADLDETVIPIEHTDLSRFTPPIHHNCRCVWVWITRDEADFTPTWETPAASKVDRFGGLVF